MELKTFCEFCGREITDDPVDKIGSTSVQAVLDNFYIEKPGTMNYGYLCSRCVYGIDTKILEGYNENNRR